MSSLLLDESHSVRRGRHEIATARECVDLDVFHAFLVESYWSAGIPRETIERAVRGSLARPDRMMEIFRPDLHRTACG